MRHLVRVARGFGAYLIRERRWWLLPVVLAVLLASVIVVLGSTPAGLLVYPLF
ncbi:MAG: hypothetical protein IT376_22285 [Polyangiaceae bacterium]|nr:hypothetical protein [Polyangiaceae bacterium]